MGPHAYMTTSMHTRAQRNTCYLIKQIETANILKSCIHTTVINNHNLHAYSHTYTQTHSYICTHACSQAHTHAYTRASTHVHIAYTNYNIAITYIQAYKKLNNYVEEAEPAIQANMIF